MDTCNIMAAWVEICTSLKDTCRFLEVQITVVYMYVYYVQTPTGFCDLNSTYVPELHQEYLVTHIGDSFMQQLHVYNLIMGLHNSKYLGLWKLTTD